MKRNIVSGVALITVSFLGSVLFSGCIQEEGPTGSLKIGSETHINNFGVGPTAQRVTSHQQPPLQQVQQVILLSDTRDMLRLIFFPEGITSDEKKLSNAISRLTTGAISANDARVMTSGSADVHLLLRPKLNIVDQTGDYYRMNCDVEIELKSANTKQVFGVKNIKLVGMRKLGKDNAIAQFDEPAAKTTAEWCRSELKRIADSELGVAMLTMQLPRPSKGILPLAERDALNIKAIGDNLGRLPNLVSYEFMGQDAQKGICTYRVVYFKSAYPGGIANEVSALIGAIAQYK